MAAVFDPERCACIDKIGSTQVWRGNLPLNKDGDFAYHEIAAHLPLDPGMKLIDVSLIDNVKGSERDQWKVELNAYSVSGSMFPPAPDIPPQFNQPNWNPAQLLGSGVKLKYGEAPGHLVWWQIEGGHDGIVLGPETKSYNFIGLLKYLGELRKLDEAMLYIHCMNGTDRTGAVVAGYAITYLDMNLDQAMDLANSLKPAGVMNDDYKALVKAYWEWFGHLDLDDAFLDPQ
jgi:hypothetical protein